MSKKKREPVDPEHLKPEDRMKFEIEGAGAGGQGNRRWLAVSYRKRERQDRRSCDKKEERNVRKNAGQGEFRGKLPLKQWRFSFIIRDR